METRYVLKEEVDNKAPAEEPWLYTYEEVIDFIRVQYGFEKEVNELVQENQNKVFEWIIDEDFIIINDDESYSWYESMCEYDFTDEWD